MLVVRGRRVVTPEGARAAAVRVAGGRIVAVEDWDGAAGSGGAAGDSGGRRETGPGGGEVVELADDEVLLPGLVDTHVHVNEPGRTDWEGFASATRAAAAGGVTTVVDMPLNCIPPTLDAAALDAKRRAAAGCCHVDVGFWGGSVPGNLGQLAGLHEAGVLGFKSFTIDSGVPEFPPLDYAGLESSMREVAALGSVQLVHAEDAGVVAAALPPSGRRYAGFLASRPGEAEVAAVARVVALARETGARCHVLHLSSAAAMDVLAAARAGGARVSAETCPHYLTLAAEDVPDGATQYKCCPPVRGRANAERLWAALRAGVIGCVVSDHSPCPPAMKRLADGDFGAAWGGISSVQLGLPVVWTAAAARGFSLADVARWMAAGPARLAGLDRKGTVAPGLDADLVAFAPDEEFVVDTGRLHHRHKLTPYAGMTLCGVVRRTWLRGAAVDGSRPAGRLLARETAA